jgi:hypothetical protein
MSFPEIMNRMRRRFEQPTTIYVSKTGDDSNDGLSPEKAILTLARMKSRIGEIDLGSYGLTVNLGAGTWNEQLYIPIDTLAGGVTVVGQGDSTVISGEFSGGATLVSSGYNATLFQNFKISSVSTHMGVGIHFGGTFEINNLTIEGCVVSIFAGSGGRIRIRQANRIVGKANNDTGLLSGGGTLECISGTLQFVGNPTFSYAVAAAIENGNILTQADFTVSGSAVGKRYIAYASGTINTAGRGANFWPGTQAGEVDNTSRYM